MYPTYEQIEQLHRKYALSEELFELVFTHCKIVSEIAEELIQKKGLDANKDLVKTSALLHDIGTYKFMDEFTRTGTSKYYQHGLEGYNILKQEGLPEEICLVVLHHMRLGLTKEAIQHEQLDLPVEDYSPTTIEEQLVMFADKFHSKKPQFNSYEGYKNFISQFGEAQVNTFVTLAEKFGTPDIAKLGEKYHHPIK